uniref:GRF-type domain-containing protein n=1 Tax=Lactuca sativa TaxID=4236 RepID=A0A9R1UYH1_LACSA|nr:hypothetical protein LSAT_V11C700360260 [Lactuca sativa]
MFELWIWSLPLTVVRGILFSSPRAMHTRVFLSFHLWDQNCNLISLFNLDLNPSYPTALSAKMVTIICFCGNNYVLRTSWTPLNPGRWFYACPLPDSKCRFLGWFDPPMCDRATAIIPGLLKSMNNLKLSVKELEDEIQNLRFYLKMTVKELEDEVCKLKFYLWCSWIFFLVFWMWN